MSHPAPTLFNYENYKLFLRDMIEARKDQPGYKTKLAKAAGCQKSFLSQVVNSHVHLTVDHAARLCFFWDFKRHERTYFIDLVLLERAASKELRGLIEDRIRDAQNKNAKLHNRVKGTYILPLQDQSIFYSSWYYAAIYMLIDAADSPQPNAMAKRLAIKESTVVDVLETLEKIRLIERKDGKWVKSHVDLFVTGSPMRQPFLCSWRQMACMKLQDEAEDSTHFTSLYSLSRQDYKRLRNLLLEFIDRSREIGIPSKEETLVCLNLDYFQL